MRIWFYPPFKPLDHPNPSGDQVIAKGLFDHLAEREHQVQSVSRLRCRWIYWRPWLWPITLREQQRLSRKAALDPPDLWLTCHSYYKAPDLLGPRVAVRNKLPYVVFQGSFATKRRRRLKTLPGYILNRRALSRADMVFVNRRDDNINMRRLLPPEKVVYVAPGIHPCEFEMNLEKRQEYRRQWKVGDSPVILTAAMFRSDVKTKGLAWVIRACGVLQRSGHDLYLAIAGDGREKAYIHELAKKELGDRVRFAGRLLRSDMHGFYSAGDFFAFPGFDESLGMVYLEAQSCGLPVVAMADGGIPEVVQDGVTGILTPVGDFDAFTNAIRRFLESGSMRDQYGRAASARVRQYHDLKQNYQGIEDHLKKVVMEHTGSRRV
jgi:glycosyltransferase involved in cell wall biosynthesis